MAKKIKLSDGSTYQVKNITEPTISPAGRRYFGTQKRDARFMTEDIIRVINNGIRDAALEIVNELAEIGPDWDGNFKNEWVVNAIEGGVTGKGTYPYTLDDIPELPVTKKSIGRVKKYEIVNESEYAPYALDLVAGRFSPHFADNATPNKAPEDRGKRDITRETFRGELTSEPGQGQSTAELDWYNKYTGGGGLQKSLKTGFNRRIKFGN